MEFGTIVVLWIRAFSFQISVLASGAAGIDIGGITEQHDEWAHLTGASSTRRCFGVGRCCLSFRVNVCYPAFLLNEQVLSLFSRLAGFSSLLLLFISFL